MLRTVCPQCGTPWERDNATARCPQCQPSRHDRPDHSGRTAAYREQSASRRAYNTRAWRRLSKMARERQPFCSDCGSPYDLTTDHSPDAWQRYDAGLTVRLEDVDVVCNRCNAERGPARGPLARPRSRPGLPVLEDLELDDVGGLPQRSGWPATDAGTPG